MFIYSSAGLGRYMLIEIDTNSDIFRRTLLM